MQKALKDIQALLDADCVLLYSQKDGPWAVEASSIEDDSWTAEAPTEQLMAASSQGHWKVFKDHKVMQARMTAMSEMGFCRLAPCYAIVGPLSARLNKVLYINKISSQPCFDQDSIEKVRGYLAGSYS